MPDETLYANDEPFTVDDCIASSDDALAEVDAAGAYGVTIEQFFELTPGFVCYGGDCWEPGDFTFL